MQQLPHDYAAWVLTKGGCSCDLCENYSFNEMIGVEGSVVLRADAIDIIRQLTAGLDKIFLYIHYYNGNISSEKLPVGRKICITLNALCTTEPFPRDTLIELSRSPNQRKNSNRRKPKRL